jgi:two-component system cell cycle sensor histidine kinase/response regulator CckA
MNSSHLEANNSPPLESIHIKAVLFGITYFTCAIMGSLLSLKSAQFVNFWLPGGLFVAILIISEKRHWPVLVLTALIANNCFDILNGKSLAVSFLFSITNCLESIVGAWLVLRFTVEKPTLSSLREVSSLIFFTAVLSPMVGATFGATIVKFLIGGNPYWHTWLIWWSGDAVGVLLLAPLVLTWLPRILRPTSWKLSAHAVKAFLSLTILAIASVLVFHNYWLREYQIKFILFPILFWIAYQFAMPGVTIANLLVAVIATWVASHYHDISSINVDQYHQVIYSQTFFSVFSIIGLLIAVVISERKRSEERYRLLFNSGDNAIFLHEGPVNGLPGKFIEVNKVACDRLGYSHKEFIQMSPLDIDAPETVPNIPTIIEKLLAERNTSWEGVHVSKDGRKIPVEISNHLFELDGKTTILSVARDIAERKRAEEFKKESEQRLNFHVDNSPMATIEWDSKFNVTRWAGEAHRMFGWSQAETIGKPVIDLHMIYEEDIPKVKKTIKQLTDGSVKYVVSTNRNYTKDGKVIYCEWYNSILSNAQGELVSVLSQVLDITDRKLAEDELRELNEKFSVAFNCAPIMISISKLQDGTYLDINQKYLDVSGFSREEVIGKTSIELGWITETDRNLLKEIMLQEGKVYELDLNLKTKSGQTVLCKYWGEIIAVAGEKRLLSVALDISEHRRVEQQFLQAQKMELVGRLAGGVAHDFNNMLGVIIGHSELALMKLEPYQPIYSNLIEINTAAERSADLTRQLLAFARKQTIAPKVIDLNDTIAGMLKMLQRLIGENINLNWHPAPNLWQVRVDPSQIDQILANLCVNARDAITDVGTITIETVNSSIDANDCVAHTYIQPGEYVRLVVSDNGSGMDKETLEHIFEPFFTTKELGVGTGLGLATVYGIIQQNNAFINVYSESGHGAAFTIYLPRYLGEQGEAQQKSATIPNLRGSETILLVEDEPTILKTTTLMLEGLGYTVLIAGSASEAIRQFKENTDKIQMLMSDVVMPDMNGRDLAKELLSHDHQLNCLFMSGYTADIIARQGVLDREVNFIQKPFSLSDLATKVRFVLDSN